MYDRRGAASVKMSRIKGRPEVLAFRHSIFERCILNNTVQTLKAANTMKNISMALLRKLPNFPQYIIEGYTSKECRPGDAQLNSEEP